MTFFDKYKVLGRVYRLTNQPGVTPKGEFLTTETQEVLDNTIETDTESQEAVATLGAETAAAATQLELELGLERDMQQSEEVVEADQDLEAYLLNDMRKSEMQTNTQRERSAADMEAFQESVANLRAETAKNLAEARKNTPKSPEAKKTTKAEAKEVAKNGVFKKIFQKCWAGLTNLGKNPNNENKSLKQKTLEALKIAGIVVAGGVAVGLVGTGLLVAAPGIISLAGALTGGTATTAALGVSFANIGLATAATTTAQVMSLAAGGGIAGLGMGAAAISDKLRQKPNEKVTEKQQSNQSADKTTPNPTSDQPAQPSNSSLENRETQNQSVDLNSLEPGTRITLQLDDGFDVKGVVSRLPDGTMGLTLPETTITGVVKVATGETGGMSLKWGTLEENSILNLTDTDNNLITKVNLKGFKVEEKAKTTTNTETTETKEKPRLVVKPKGKEGSAIFQILGSDKTVINLPFAYENMTQASEAISEVNKHWDGNYSPTLTQGADGTVYIKSSFPISENGSQGLIGHIAGKSEAVQIPKPIPSDPTKSAENISTEQVSNSEDENNIKIEGGTPDSKTFKIKLNAGGIMTVPETFESYKVRKAAVKMIADFTNFRIDGVNQRLNSLTEFKINQNAYRLIPGFMEETESQDINGEADPESSETQKTFESTNIFEKGGYTSLFQVNAQIEDTVKLYNKELESNLDLKSSAESNISKINDKLPEGSQISLDQYQANYAAKGIFDSLPDSLKALAESMSQSEDFQSKLIPNDADIDEAVRDDQNQGAKLNFALDSLKSINTDALDKSRKDIENKNTITEPRQHQQIIAQNFAEAVVNNPDPAIKEYVFGQMGEVLKKWDKAGNQGIDLESIKNGGLTALKQLPQTAQEQFGKLAEQIFAGGTIDTINPSTGEINYFVNGVEIEGAQLSTEQFFNDFKNITADSPILSNASALREYALKCAKLIPKDYKNISLPHIQNGLSGDPQNISNSDALRIIRSLAGSTAKANGMTSKEMIDQVHVFMDVASKKGFTIDTPTQQSTSENPETRDVTDILNDVRSASRLNSFGQPHVVLGLNDAFKNLRTLPKSKDYLSKLPPETLLLALDSLDEDIQNTAEITQATITVKEYLYGCYITEIFADTNESKTRGIGFKQSYDMWIEDYPKALTTEEKNTINEIFSIDSSTPSDLDVKTKIKYGAALRKFDDFLSDQQA